MTEIRESAELRSGWQRCWHGESRTSARNFSPWDISSQGMEWGPCCTTRNTRKGQKDCLAFARETNFPCEKAEEGRKGGIVSHVLSKDQITSGKVEITQEEKVLQVKFLMPWEAGALQKEGGWTFARNAKGQFTTAKEGRMDRMWRSLPTLSPCLHSARMWDELCPGGLHQHFPTRQAHYSIKTNSAPNKEKTYLVIMSNSLLNTM